MFSILKDGGKIKIKTILVLVLLVVLSSNFICNSKTVKPGENRLTIDLKSKSKDLNSQANVYLNKKFVGMTDKNGDLKINLRKGEYSVRITLDGYENWNENILMVGAGYKQNISPDLKKIGSQ